MIALFLFDGETLICERIYFDSMTMMRQLLAGLPAPAQLQALSGMLGKAEAQSAATA
jgi:hypothetical protein